MLHTVLRLAQPIVVRVGVDGVKLAQCLNMKCLQKSMVATGWLFLWSGFVSSSAIAAISTTQTQVVPAGATATSATTQVQPEIQPLPTISDAVENFLISQAADPGNLSVTVKRIDSRLRLAHCSEPLESSWSPGSRTLGRVTVQIACAAPRPWRVHVQATVTMQGMVWTLSRGVRRDEALDLSLLVQQEMTIGENSIAFRSMGTPITDINPWLGFVFTQRVNAGKVLNEQMLKPAQLVNKGDAVVIQHKASGLKIQTRGVALHNAGIAAQTQVRNTSSGKIVDVVVVAPGTVETLQ